MKKLIFIGVGLAIVLSLSLCKGNTQAAPLWYACFYDGSGCAQVPAQYGPTYAPAQTSMAACLATCAF